MEKLETVTGGSKNAYSRKTTHSAGRVYQQQALVHVVPGRGHSLQAKSYSVKDERVYSYSDSWGVIKVNGDGTTLLHHL